ncbi:MAG: cysteine desulfurase family protein [Bryobacteraceae bacterium]
MMDRPVYFDYNATTPLAPEVLDVFVSVLRETYGNASSIHRPGQAARQLLEQGRRQVAALLCCDPKEIVFVSGGTEGDNLALFGTVRRARNGGRHVITTAIEHPAILSACAQLEREGVEVTYARVGAGGVVDPDEIRCALRPETTLISVMHANNEVGTVQPVAEIAKIAREAGVAMHSDGVQAAGKIAIDVRALGVDLYTISAHKICAPKGIGALYVGRGMKIEPQLHGGRHERERRAGTENVPAAAAFGRAAGWIRENLDTETARLAALRDRLEQGILARVPSVTVNGSGAPRVPNTTNLCFDGIEGEAMVIALDLKGFAVSTGAACSSGAVEPSHVLTAMGLAPEKARASIRFSLGRQNTPEQVDALIEAVAETADRLRKLSPTYTVHA